CRHNRCLSRAGWNRRPGIDPALRAGISDWRRRRLDVAGRGRRLRLRAAGRSGGAGVWLAVRGGQVTHMLIDLNCDLGEGAGTDAERLPLITSANVSCGAHAGSPGVILTTLELAAKHGVTVGAHPGHRDRENFGRRELRLPRRDLVELIHAQIVSLGA